MGKYNVLKREIPHYNEMKMAGAFTNQTQKKKRKQRQILTEYCESRQKVVLKQHVTINQAAKKLNDYESTGLSPQEVRNIIEQVRNMTERIKKLEDWQ